MTPFGRIAAELDAGRRAALVTIVSVQGSSPREAGTRMVVTQAGYSGTIGGGAMEWQAIAEAQRLIAAEPDGAGLSRSFALGPDLGQCCGGRVTLLIEAFTPADRDWIAPLAEAGDGAPFHTRGIADPRGIHRRERMDVPAGSLWTGSLWTGSFCGDDGARAGTCCLADGVLIEQHGEMRTPLLLFGAGHVGRALVLALAPLPFATRWIDTRADAFPGHHPGNVTPVATSAPPYEIDAAPPGSIVLVMTHSHALDLAIADAALSREDLPFVGVIGSASKAARFRSRLRDAGHGAAALARFSCPIGPTDLGSKAPAVIAAGIAVEMLRLRARANTSSEALTMRARNRHLAR